MRLGLQLAGDRDGRPGSFGVLTVDTVAQAEASIGKAAEAVRSALEMADLFARLAGAVQSVACLAPLHSAAPMSKICAICGKKPGSAITAPTRWSPRSAGSTRTCSASGAPERPRQRAYVCTRRLKGDKVTKAI